MKISYIGDLKLEILSESCYDAYLLGVMKSGITLKDGKAEMCDHGKFITLTICIKGGN